MTNAFLDILMENINSDAEVLTFLHNTNTQETALSILENGFKFVSHLDYSTDNVSAKDEVTVKYFTLTRKAYGQFTVIIQIAREIIERYSAFFENTPHHFSEALTIYDPELTSDDEYIFQLAPQFIKGFINSNTCMVVLNPYFDPFFQSELFQKNLNRILERMNQ